LRDHIDAVAILLDHPGQSQNLAGAKREFEKRQAIAEREHRLEIEREAGACR
jgi:hypothetical protein